MEDEVGDRTVRGDQDHRLGDLVVGAISCRVVASEREFLIEQWLDLGESRAR